MESRSPSSVSITPTGCNDRRCEVFVSFCGEDTRYNFTDHLFAALQRNDIFTFRDDNNLPQGDSLVPEILGAIEDSQVYVTVFSRNYASSTLCLQELEKILECSQLHGKHVLSVFYDVDPSEVPTQTGCYGEAFAQHEEKFGHDTEKVRRWREALTQVGNISGWDLRDKSQSAAIENIVETIVTILNFDPEFPSVLNDLVGMDSSIDELEKFLLLGSVDGVRVVGIYGVGGIGKTTLATSLYNKISDQFDACCLIDDFSKIYKEDGPIGVQKQILHQTLGEKHNQINNLYDHTQLILRRIYHRRALIVLDNVGQSEQLEKVGVNRLKLAERSRIVIVCRDAHVLKEYGVKALYKVPLLNETNSLQLFCRKAFKCDIIANDYEDLTNAILKYANGLPLVIKVLGSSLSGPSISEWCSALEILKKNPDNDIMQFCFDGLEENEREIFLHIACFFNRCEENYVKNVLNCCGFHADLGFIVLINKSLISISDENKIEMHALLEELGRKIVHENSSIKSRKLSKLWLYEQFHNVVAEKMENKVDAVVLCGFEREKRTLMAETLSQMNCLRLLILKEAKFSGSLNYLSDQLRYVEWDEYPFLYLPSIFQPNQLCELILVDSSIEQLWEVKKNLPNLRNLDLSYSENLTKMTDFGEFPTLKRLNLEGCVELVQIDSSIGLLKELVFLNLKNCESLICIPNEISGLTSLKFLNLCGCCKAFKNPKAREDFSIYVMSSLPSFSCLSELDISFCSLSEIPDALGCLPWLERLNLRGNNFVKLPSLRDLSKLEYLNLEHCKQLTSLPELSSPTDIKQDKHKRAGMFIFNCSKLGEREQCSNMTFSWMMHFIQANHGSASFHQIDIVTPGSEIPKWFINQRMGRSISIDPFPIVYDDNIIGMSCCVVFSVEPFDPTMTRYEWAPVIRLGFKSINAANSNYVVIPVTLYRHLITVKSYHMWLIYFDWELFLSFLSNDDKWEHDHIKMEASVTNGQGLHLEVKNCGYRWVFKQDQQSFSSLKNDSLWNEETIAVEPETLVVIEDDAQPQSQAQ